MFFNLENARVRFETQGLCSIDLPHNAEGKMLTAVIAVHGSNRGAEDYDTTPFYAEQKRIALENGCLFGAISNKLDTWGFVKDFRAEIKSYS